MSLAEFSLIDRIRARTRDRADIVLGIGDDAALLQPQPGLQLVVTADTLNSGVHFPPETPAADIGWKTLAVNLSDLASMGATPAWCTLALSLPSAEADWIDAFAEGFFALADAHDIVLIGGDTTRGPLSLSVTAMGQVNAGAGLRRDAAQVGDEIWVSGTLGDAAVALRAWQSGTLDVGRAADDVQVEFLRQRGRPRG
jgi:thiamine-monophosphate kinase